MGGLFVHFVERMGWELDMKAQDAIYVDKEINAAREDVPAIAAQLHR